MTRSKNPVACPSRGWQRVAGLVIAGLLAACQAPTTAPRPAMTAVPEARAPTSAPTQTVASPATPSAVVQAAPTRVRKLPWPITLPDGFGIGVFASGLGVARFMAVSDSGDLFLSVPADNRVLVLPDRDADGVADEVSVYASTGLDRPHGLAFRDGWLYVANTGSVARFEYHAGDVVARSAAQVVVPNLPAGGNHWTRTIAFGPDGGLYVSVGSSCNVCEESDPRRAAITRYAADGTAERVFASGLRNAVGIEFHPRSAELWATENGRDLLGDDVPPEEVDLVLQDRHYGWPYCYGQRVWDADFGRRGPDFCAITELPAVEMQAHSAPLGLAFYTGRQFPPAYQGNLFVAFHGSWNRTVPTGYKLVRLPFSGRGRPTGEVIDFATGWLVGDKSWGRPVDVVVGPDGSLFVSDDRYGAVYRIYYAGPNVG